MSKTIKLELSRLAVHEIDEMLKLGVDANIVLLDYDAKPGQLTKRFFLLMEDVFRENIDIPITQELHFVVSPKVNLPLDIVESNFNFNIETHDYINSTEFFDEYTNELGAVLPGHFDKNNKKHDKKQLVVVYSDMKHVMLGAY
jgi:hypothetical protein